MDGAQPVAPAPRCAGTARFGCCRRGGGVAGGLAGRTIVGRARGSTTPAPIAAPAWFGSFAVGHPSDISWNWLVYWTYSPVVRYLRRRGGLNSWVCLGAIERSVFALSGLKRSGLDVSKASAAHPLGSSNVPESAQDPDLLTAAAVALNRHASVLGDLGSAFAAAGHELYLVGGSVRDAVLARLSPDLDFATDARPEQVQKIVRPWADAVWDTGIEFGTIGVGKGDYRLEITTFRADSYDQVSRNPEVRFGDRIDDDLVRRDFTVNAMAVRITAGGLGEFLDPLGGLVALRAGILDTPAAPSVSFGDDPLRMLRAARFVSQLGFTVAPRVRAAIDDMAPQLTRISAERVAAELDKLMLGRDPVGGIDLLVQTGMGAVVLPEIGGMQMAIDEHHQHKDVYQHSLTVLRQAIGLEDPESGADLVLRWAALLHDIGKPATRRHEPNGGVSFHHHEVVGAKMVRKRMRALKYSKQMVDDVSQLVFLHLRFHGYGDGKWTDSAVRRYVTDAGPLLPRLHKLVRADCTTRNQRRAARLRANYDQLEERIAELAAQEDLARVRPDLDGNQIMALLDIPAGPEVGEAWRYLKELRLDRGPMSNEEATVELLAWWRSRGNR